MSFYFNAKEETASFQDYSVLPAGVYHMTVWEMELKTDRSENEYIKLVLAVCDGEHKSRKHFENLYLDSEFENAQRQARIILKSLCEAAGIEALQGPSDFLKLIGAEIDVKMAVYKKKDGNEMNIINNIRKHQASEPAPVKAQSNDVKW